MDLEYKKGNEMEHDFFNDQVEITNLDVSYQEKYYDCCPDEAYPSLTVDLEFNQKMKYKDGQLMGAAAEWFCFCSKLQQIKRNFSNSNFHQNPSYSLVGRFMSC